MHFDFIMKSEFCVLYSDGSWTNRHPGSVIRELQIQTDLKSNISAGDNHVVVLDDHVRAEPPLGVPLNVAVGVAGIDSCGSLRNENGFYLYPIES